MCDAGTRGLCYTTDRRCGYFSSRKRGSRGALAAKKGWREAGDTGVYAEKRESVISVLTVTTVIGWRFAYVIRSSTYKW